MSGIAGVFRLDDSRVDPAWLDQMAGCLAIRGPDGSHVWSDGRAGLCHTLLRTWPENESSPESERQPSTIDGQVWIVADARIDDRETLISKLQPLAPQDLRRASSAQLILHAYARWDVHCVEHLLGDFAFIVWDAPRRRVFCARDHLGVKPFYYSLAGQCLVASNTLECLRQHPFVSKDLNDQAIADFLLFGMNREADTTYFSDIRRLPAAHRMVASAEGIRIEKFWELPIDEPLYLRKSTDYVEQFRELLRASLRDRLPRGNLGISMSGGIDSSALAATSVEMGASPVAFTTVVGSDDSERIYARAVAKHLGIRIHFRDRQEERREWPPEDPYVRTSEPSSNVLELSSTWSWPIDVANRPRVIFYGEGPDNALTYEWRAYLAYLDRTRRWGRMVWDVFHHVAAHRRIPLLPTLPRIWREKRNPLPGMVFPVWLNPELISRWQLRKRWDQFPHVEPSVHPVRPQSELAFRDVAWPVMFEMLDLSAAEVPFEFRHPFIDLRLLRFMLAVPAMPWCREKHLLRRAMRGKLPREVLCRPKTPARASIAQKLGRGLGMPTWRQRPPSLSRYLDWNHVSMDGVNSAEYDNNMRAIGLHYWLLGL